MSRLAFTRKEMSSALLDFGSVSIDLADYATTGLRIVAVGPSGIGKTNAGLLVAEQLAAQGWQCILMDPEGELAALYPEKVITADNLLFTHIVQRYDPAISVVPVKDAEEFIPFGEAILRAVDKVREPVFVMLDEGQLFSTSRRGKGKQHEASALVTDMAERGRKRALDLLISAQRFAGTLSRSIFSTKNLTLVGRQEDPAAWSALAPMFKGSGVGYAELAALNPGEFFCFSRRGVEKVVMPMAAALAKVAPKATSVRPRRPATFSQWDRAMRDIPTPRLKALTGPAIAIMATIAGLSAQQLAAGTRALQDELRTRPA